MAFWLRILVAIILNSGPWHQTAAAADTTGKSAPDFRRYITSRYDPDYPREAREHGLTGVGSALLKVDPRTGLVKSVTITKSTGHEILDKAATKAYWRWQFVPHTISSAEVPIIFKAYGALDPTLLGRARAPAIYSPMPDYPLEALRNHLSGSGIVVVEINKGTGIVTSAYMERSTGHKMLDDATLNALRRWLFRPGTISRMRIPVNYASLGLSY